MAKRVTIVTVLIFLILFIDQVSKIWIKTHFQLYESIRVTDWFYIYFIENNGMAFGMELFGKIFLTLFRIAAVGFIGYYLVKLLRKNEKFGYAITIALIFAGALGNIIDSILYGVVFDHSFGQVAMLFPVGGGYAPLFYGKVVDMLYFPFFTTLLPDWIPFYGGKEFTFFRFIFNIADSAVCVGVFSLILFYRKTLSQSLSKPEKEKES